MEGCLRRLDHIAREALLDPMGALCPDPSGLVDRLLRTLSDPAGSDAFDFHAMRRLLRRNALIANLTAVTARGTTDEAATRLLARNPDDPRLLALLSPRSRLDPAELEGAVRRLSSRFPELVSIWASNTFAVYASGMPDPEVARNLERLLSWPWLRFGDWTALQAPYLGVSYVDPTSEAGLRRSIHDDLGRQLAGVQRGVRNRPDPRRIALISDHWVEGHVVHRTMAPLIRALTSRAQVTLVHFGGATSRLDREGFERVDEVTVRGDRLELGALADNRFGLIFFADVGLHPASILLASLRLAPVQVHGPGHPVSAPGSELDVFVTGAAADPPSARRFYTERLDRLPGRGACHRLDPRPARPRAPGSLRFVVNCSWSSPKVTAPMLDLLRELAERSRKRLLFRLFSTGSSSIHGGALAFRRSVERALPAGTVEIVPFLDHQGYLEHLADGEMALDSFPFGGSNTVADSLSAGVPIVSREGERWLNRIGPALLEACDLGELVARSRDDTLRIAARLIDDDGWRRERRRRIEALDPRVLAQPDLPGRFADHLIELARVGPQSCGRSWTPAFGAASEDPCRPIARGSISGGARPR